MKPIIALAAAFAALLAAQDVDPKQRARTVRDLAKQGEDGLPAIAPYAGDADLTVRLEAVKALVSIGGPKTVTPLTRAVTDADAEMQIRATDGLVNVYLPGYVKNGLSGTLSRAGNTVRGKFTDTNDQIIDPYVQVPASVIDALGKTVRGGASMDARANAARALGVLRGRSAIPDLVDALRSKDDKLMYEALVAIGKIGDFTAAPRISFLLRDLDERIQMQALEVTGMLRNREAAPRVRDAFQNARSVKVKRAALGALAMLADPADHAIFLGSLSDKDEDVRAAAAEGLGRIGNPMDRSTLDSVFQADRAMSPRLAEAFAAVGLGDVSTENYSPLRYLFNTLNQRVYRKVASAYLTELARNQTTRRALYEMLAVATKDERIQMSGVLAQSGQSDSIPFLQALSKDPDPDVAGEGIRNLRVLRARLR